MKMFYALRLNFILQVNSQYTIISPKNILSSKSHTYIFEQMNRLLRYYFTRFERKTYV